MCQVIELIHSDLAIVAVILRLIRRVMDKSLLL